MNATIGVFFREALDNFVIVPLEESMLTFSFDHILEDNLRTLDSLQLSAGRSIDDALDEVSFVTADTELAEVADRYELPTVVPG